MRRAQKIAIYAFACLLGSAAHGQVLMPNTSTSVTGGDEVRGRDGTTCRQGTHVGPTFDTGVSFMPFSQSAQSSLAGQLAAQSLAQSSAQSQGVGIYARIVIPFGKQPGRLDCGRLYELEIERLQTELARIKESGSAGVVVN